MNENNHASESNQIQTKVDQKVQNYNKPNDDLENYEYYYYDDEEEDDDLDENEKMRIFNIQDTKQNIAQDYNNSKQEKSSLAKNTSKKDVPTTQLNISSKRETVSASVIVPNSEEKNPSIIINSNSNSEKGQYSKSLSLPDYKPKDIGKGFSSTSDDDDDEYDTNKSHKIDNQAPKSAKPIVNNDDDNYYSDDFPEESSQIDFKVKSPLKTSLDMSSNKDDQQIKDNDDDNNNRKCKKDSPSTKKKNHPHRRKNTNHHRRNKRHRKKHHSNNENNNNNNSQNTSVGSVDSSNSFDSNYSFNSDGKEDEKANSVVCDSTLAYSIGDENEEEENIDNLNPKIKKIIDDYEAKNLQIKQENDLLQQKVKQLEDDKKILQNEINQLKESNKNLQKKQQEEINNLKESNINLQKKQQDEINNLKEENKILQKKNEEARKNSSILDTPTPSFSTIDRFKDAKMRKVCLLGRGSSSKVVEFEDIKTGKHYAKKILFKEFLDFKGIKHFIAEFELLQYLSHPCTATVYGFEMGVDEDHPCSIYFEVLQVSLMSAISASDSLAQTLSTNSDSNISAIPSSTSTARFLSNGHRLFTNSLRARCLVEICCGMEYVHDCGIIHRDLKAENILFNETLNAKICDFGIAQLQSAENLTKNVGSLFYMSPEMLSEKIYDKSTDVYSFGILAYFVLTGELPKTPLPKKVLGCLPDVPPYVTPLGKKIILSCCAFNPKERPSFTDLLELMKKNNFQLINNINIDFVRKRYDELMQFKQLHPAQLIK